MAAPFITRVPVIATNRFHQTNSVGYRNQSLPPNQKLWFCQPIAASYPECRLSQPIAATKQTVSAIPTNRCHQTNSYGYADQLLPPDQPY
ncbi:hypothetical protein PoB_006275300 [Plakobranchus ocellatus]|uniref:Uncharacterized protein n=1 Tax=Plakobranchus ocellatus TaxID=259542 RepID=A0AAV4CWL2_9GAST|nr:hypothetical protein PoB_006275300 [Plakobranchus ocellatus]